MAVVHCRWLTRNWIRPYRDTKINPWASLQWGGGREVAMISIIPIGTAIDVEATIIGYDKHANSVCGCMWEHME